jgi:hypothetical protein
MITETDELAEAIEQASVLWPELNGNRAALVRQLLATGISQLRIDSELRYRERKAAVESAIKDLDFSWPTNWREESRAEWPE